MLLRLGLMVCDFFFFLLSFKFHGALMTFD